MNFETEIMDTIESGLALAGYDIVGWGEGYLLVRDKEQDRTFRLTLIEEAE